MIWFYIFIFIISCLVLVRSGTWVVRSLTRIAQFLEWREFTVAFVLMAFATSIPELFVGVTSALHLKPELSLGNIIGSNIINLTLAVTIGVLLARELKIETVIAQRSSIYTTIIASLPILLMLDGKLSRTDGVFLLLVLMFYIHQLSLTEERFTKVFSNKFKRKWKRFRLFLKDLGVFLVSLVLLLLAAEGVVQSTSFLGKKAGLPLVTIGALIVALGTNLPEIVFGVRAVVMNHEEMILGNLMGSVVSNSTLVLGLTILICPLEIPKFSLYVAGIIFTVITALFFAIFARTDRKITEKEAVFLLEIYLLFVIVEILIK